MMTMTKDNPVVDTEKAFWLVHPDPTQAAVHLALQWLAYVYPASELQIDRTLKTALPYADTDLSSRWAQFLDENDVEDHVEALKWISDTLSTEQVPFLVETCWRLLLVDHELPTHVPLALRIMGQVLRINESRLHDIGEEVFREYVEGDEQRNRAPLLPVDPRYLDRVEWRLYGRSTTQRRMVRRNQGQSRNYNLLWAFLLGTTFGVVVVVALVFGPLQLGRVKVPIMLHDSLLVEDSQSIEPPIQIAIAEPVIEQTIDQAQTELPVDIIETEIVTVSEATQIDLTAPSIEDILVEDIFVEPSAEEPTPIVFSDKRILMEVTASILNVRLEASVDSEILIKLAVGARVWAYPDMADGLWVLVKVEGKTGYASARFLTAVDSQ